MPWYKFIDNDLDICDPDSYEMLEKAPDCVDGCYLYAIFADPIPDDPLLRPDIDSTPGLLFYIIRALAKGKGQPVSLSPPVPLEVRMSPVPTRAESTKNLPADYGTLDPVTEQK
ncbi:hypothetical protein LJ658_01855 [Mucilaginibacter sp. UR6-11]|nr:hypothetical protein [Mucilaginibacter sp. UR6-11]